MADDRRADTGEGHDARKPDPGDAPASAAEASAIEAPSGDPERRARLEEIRARILDLDRELVRVVGERRNFVLEVGRLKADLGLPVLDPGREARVVRRAAELAREHDVDEELIRDVVWRIIASARDAQEGRSRWGPPEPTESSESSSP